MASTWGEPIPAIDSSFQQLNPLEQADQNPGEYIVSYDLPAVASWFPDSVIIELAYQLNTSRNARVKGLLWDSLSGRMYMWIETGQTDGYEVLQAGMSPAALVGVITASAAAVGLAVYTVGYIWYRGAVSGYIAGGGNPNDIKPSKGILDSLSDLLTGFGIAGVIVAVLLVVLIFNGKVK